MEFLHTIKSRLPGSQGITLCLQTNAVDGQVYKFNTMPSGLNNRGLHRQETMQSLFGRIKGIHIYLDDVVVAHSTIEEHHDAVQQFLQICAKYNYKLKPNKCQFLVKAFDHLGHHIVGDKVFPRDELLGTSYANKGERSCIFPWRDWILPSIFPKLL